MSTNISTDSPIDEDGSLADAAELEEGFDDCIEVHRDGPLSGFIGIAAAAVAVAYLLRAVGSGSLLDWLLCVVTGTVAALYLATLVDSRAPLMVIDEHGVRVRRGPQWQGVAWPEVCWVEHRARMSMLRDGALTVVDVDGHRLGVRLSLSTRLVGADWHEVSGAITELAGGRAEVVETGRRTSEDVETATATATAPDLDPEIRSDVDVVEPDEAPEPSREPVLGRRTEVVLEPTTVPAQWQEDSSEDWQAEEETSVIHLASLAGEAVADPDDETAVIAGAAEVPVGEPVVGLVLAQARERLGLSIDQLAERTRIRPHVIEAIEADEFESCGGDFYARGHLRTLSRVLGVEVAPLLDEYDARYSHAPIDPRRVFEAELATNGASGRGVGGGLNWSVLVAVVMAVVLVWSVTRLVMDGPVQLSDQPVLNGSPGGKASLSGATAKVPVSFTAVTGGARVIVRDANQQVVFDEQLAFMQTAELTVAPPVRISTTDGGLQVSVDGEDKGALGATGQDAQQTFVP